jgi:hypothetical protein
MRDCPIAQQGITSKYVMKVFKMQHSNIFYGAIVRDACTFHGVNEGLAAIGHMVCDDFVDQQANIQEKDEDIGSSEMTTTTTYVKNPKLRDLIDQVFDAAKSNAIEIPML